MTDRTVLVRVVADTAQFGPEMVGAAKKATVLGDATAAAGRGTRAMAKEAGGAEAAMVGLGTGARGGAAGAAEAEAQAAKTGRAVRAASTEVDAGAAAFGRIGTAGRDGMAAVEHGAEGALEMTTHLGTLLAGGALLLGLHDIVHQGNEYNDALQKYQEVTRASGAQMAVAGAQAQALGADLKLPTATAAEAADAMVELAKAGLSAQDAVTAARGTIQLAAAARTDVATAAKIQGDILDEFNLKATDSTRVADILANTVNSTSGELMDLYYAMKYVGPTAHSLSIPLQDVATAVGLLGKSGIIGDTAGTSLRSALVNMAKPTKQAREGLHELGIEAFDSQGRFKGLEYVITQLHTAQEHLSEQQFTAAAAMAFGKPALSAMTALAHQGGEAFQQFGVQVGRAGGAAALASAESKGLGGAMRSLGKEISSAFLQVYLGLAPTLEGITRWMSSGVSAAIPHVQRGIKDATDLWTIYGPTVERILAQDTNRIATAAGRFAAPVGRALLTIGQDSIPVAVSGFHALETVVHNAGSAVVPLVGGLQSVVTSVSSGAGAVSVLTGRLQVGFSLFGGLSSELRPLAAIVGDLGHAFAGLPGPIQLSILGMIAMRPFRPQIQALQDTVTGYGRSATATFNEVRGSMQLQSILAEQAGVSLGKWGSGFAAVEARVPVIGEMATSFRTTSAAVEEGGGKLAGFRGNLAGVATAAGVGAKAGLKGALSGVVSLLGGPWGIAIGAAMIGLDMLAQHQQEAAAATEAHRQRISSLAQALQQSNGQIDASVRSATVQTLADAKLKDGKTQLLDVMQRAGVSTLQLTDAYLGQGDSLTALHDRLMAAAEGYKTVYNFDSDGNVFYTYDQQGKAILKAADAINSLTGEAPAAIAKQKDLAAAIAGSGAAAGNATDPAGRLKKIIGTLSDTTADADTRARSLHDALTLLSGGELDVQAATAKANQSALDLAATYKDSVDHARGYGAALLQVDGSLNTTSENGQQLWNKLQDLNSAVAGAAQATYDLATANGADLPTALKAAEAPMQQAWQQAVTAAQQFGLTADQAKNLAAQMGFIPSNLAITLGVKGLGETQAQLLYVQGLAGHLPPGATIKVSALTDDAVKQLRQVGIEVTSLPGGRQMEITAPTDKAAAALDALIAKEVPGKQVDVTAQTRQAIADLDTVGRTVQALPGAHTVTVAALTQGALDALHAVGYTTETLPDGRVKVTVPTGDPLHSLQQIQDQINALTDKTIHVKTINDFTITGGTGPYGNKPLPNADGGIYSRAMAAGGITTAADGLSGRQAMVASRPILWAEAGPEAYIPLSPSKRQRSTALLGQVAGQFGYQLVPARAMTALAPASAGPSYDQRTTNVHLHGAQQSDAEQRADLVRHLQFVS
ncbi:phage tail tape measure protein [Streptomyces tateyamensis]|uniref:Phage tail tape measure protein n=1 Tax=Streptomyces tateyamensis TaxID=565073 RepID=A0A2V4NQI6_9ACTN|nr:phage tail tape measure protein [Streptomyces tateyamensis]PYC83458.1 phage tail tape measure protein [Streptomyces tateyamensis]